MSLYLENPHKKILNREFFFIILHWIQREKVYDQERRWAQGAL